MVKNITKMNSPRCKFIAILIYIRIVTPLFEFSFLIDQLLVCFAVLLFSVLARCAANSHQFVDHRVAFLGKILPSRRSVSIPVCLRRASYFSSKSPWGDFNRKTIELPRHIAISILNSASLTSGSDRPRFSDSDYEYLISELVFAGPSGISKTVENNIEKMDESFYKCMVLVFFV